MPLRKSRFWVSPFTKASLSVLVALTSTSLQARQAQDQPYSSMSPPESRPLYKSLGGARGTGISPRSAVGVVGQRQSSNGARANLQPTGRINSRIANRVQSRIRNRIDRFYDPRANTTSPFVVAADRAQEAATQSAR